MVEVLGMKIIEKERKRKREKKKNQVLFDLNLFFAASAASHAIKRLNWYTLPMVQYNNTTRCLSFRRPKVTVQKTDNREARLLTDCQSRRVQYSAVQYSMNEYSTMYSAKKMLGTILVLYCFLSY
jgi:hypothetical protein